MTTALSKHQKPITFTDSKGVAIEGGNIAKRTRLDIESKLGTSIVTSLNASEKSKLEIEMPKRQEDENNG